MRHSDTEKSGPLWGEQDPAWGSFGTSQEENGVQDQKATLSLLEPDCRDDMLYKDAMGLEKRGQSATYFTSKWACSNSSRNNKQQQP